MDLRELEKKMKNEVTLECREFINNVIQDLGETLEIATSAMGMLDNDVAPAKIANSVRKVTLNLSSLHHLVQEGAETYQTAERFRFFNHLEYLNERELSKK